MKEKEFYPLLGDLNDVPHDYIVEVAHTKRFLERFIMDPKFRDAFEADAAGAMSALALRLTPGQVIPLIDPVVGAEVAQALAAGDADACPASVLRYHAFIEEKLALRGRLREEVVPSDPRMAVWRQRQVNRCIGELGDLRSSGLVHAPAAFEIAKGCTVGCWFCGVAAPKFEHTWPYTEKNAALWRGCLKVAQEEIGPAAYNGFLYWATDPLDNPDYESFLKDFWDVLGRCPQTTTAIPHRDLQRTRDLLALTRSLDSIIDRFSIISLSSLYQVHETFSAEELLRVELVPQVKEAADMGNLKANAGRARKFAGKRGKEMVPEWETSTIACVSGFLFNMVERSVRLITPCNANERWPLGYWVLDRGTFSSPEELRALLRSMITTKMRQSLRNTDIVRLRPNVQAEGDGQELRLTSRGPGLLFSDQPQAAQFAAVLAEGTRTAGEIAQLRLHDPGVPVLSTLTVLDQLFARGLLDEEPPVDTDLAPELRDLVAQGIT